MGNTKDQIEYLGMSWDPSRIVRPEDLRTQDVRFVLFRLKKALPDFVFHDGYLEGNPISWPEVKTLMDGVSIGGHSVSDVEQILNLKRAWEWPISLVQENRFAPRKRFFRDQRMRRFRGSPGMGCFQNGSGRNRGNDIQAARPGKTSGDF